MRRIALLALVAYVFVGANSAGIWCFGSDGHVAFERLDAEHPLVSDGTEVALRLLATSMSADSAGSARPHGPCFDVALDAGSQRYAAARPDGPGVLAPAVPSTAAADLLALPHLLSTARAALAGSDAACDRALAPLRSTVLRI